MVHKICDGINKVMEKRKILHSYSHENDSYKLRKVLAKKNCTVSLLVTQANSIIMRKYICKCVN